MNMNSKSCGIPALVMVAGSVAFAQTGDISRDPADKMTVPNPLEIKELSVIMADGSKEPKEPKEPPEPREIKDPPNDP